MSHILKRKINNVIYVYQEKSYRDKLGRPRTKQKCLGKLDNNGVLILSKKRNPENLPATITKYKIIITKFRIKAITDSHNKQSQPQNLNNSRKSAKPRANITKYLTDSHKQAAPRANILIHKWPPAKIPRYMAITEKFCSQEIMPENSQINLRKYKL